MHYYKCYNWSCQYAAYRGAQGKNCVIRSRQALAHCPFCDERDPGYLFLRTEKPYAPSQAWPIVTMMLLGALLAWWIGVSWGDAIIGIIAGGAVGSQIDLMGEKVVWVDRE